MVADKNAEHFIAELDSTEGNKKTNLIHWFAGIEKYELDFGKLVAYASKYYPKRTVGALCRISEVLLDQ